MPSCVTLRWPGGTTVAGTVAPCPQCQGLIVTEPPELAGRHVDEASALRPTAGCAVA